MGAQETALAAKNLNISGKSFMNDAVNVARRIDADMSFVNGVIRAKLIEEADKKVKEAEQVLADLD